VTWNKDTTEEKSLIYGQTFKNQEEEQKKNAQFKRII
jgi:hypothetical protein